MLFIILGYLSGSILYAKVFSRLLKKGDVYERGKDKNPGTANAFTYGGFLCGILTLCGDLLKGFLPVYLYTIGSSGIESSSSWTFAAVLAAPVLGHTFSVINGFRGGKGIAVTFGCLLGLLPDILHVGIFAAFFIFFSIGLRIVPHFYRTIVTYLCTVIALFYLNPGSSVNIGFLLISIVVLLRLHQSEETRERLQIKLLWMR